MGFHHRDPGAVAVGERARGAARDECDAPAVGGPRGLAIVRRVVRKSGDTRAVGVHDPDLATATAMRYECDHRAIRRPTRIRTRLLRETHGDRKSTRLNSSHSQISY